MLYAKKGSEIVYIDYVENGLKSNCICLSCQSKLIARNQGHKRIHHFAHANGMMCKFGNETSLHYQAKTIIENAQYINMPKIRYSLDCENENSYDRLDIIHVKLEHKIHNIIPDIIVVDKNNQTICIEIKVHHEVSQEKLNIIKKLKLNTIEVDLSKFIGIQNDDLYKVLIEGINYKKWLYHIDKKPDLNLFDYSENIMINMSLDYIWAIMKSPFLAKLNNSTISVFITSNPNDQYRKYGSIYGTMFIRGKNHGNRVIYGAFDKQWQFIPKK
jgi:hypothetical protein